MSRPLAWDLECWDPSDDDHAEGGHPGDLEHFLRVAEAMQPQTPDELAELIIKHDHAQTAH